MKFMKKCSEKTRNQANVIDRVFFLHLHHDKWTSEIYASFPGGGQEENMTLAERKILKELFSPHQRDHKAKTLSLQKLLLNKKMKIIQKF